MYLIIKLSNIYSKINKPRENRDKSIIIIKDSNNTLSLVDRTSQQKLNKNERFVKHYQSIWHN